MIPEGFCQSLVNQSIDYSIQGANRNLVQEAWAINRLNDLASDGWTYCSQHDFFNRLYEANPLPDSCKTNHQKQEFRMNLLHPLLRNSDFKPKEFSSGRNVGARWSENRQCEPSSNALADIVGYREEELVSACILPTIIDVKVYGATHAGNGISILRLKRICENIIEFEGDDSYTHHYISILENADGIVETCTESNLVNIDVNGDNVGLNIAGGGGQLQINSNPNQDFNDDQRAWAEYTLVPLYASDLRKISLTMEKYLGFGDARNLRDSLMDVIESSSQWGRLDPTFTSSFSTEEVNGSHLANLNDDIFTLLHKLTFFDTTIPGGYNINEFIRLNLLIFKSTYPVEYEWYRNNNPELLDFLVQLNNRLSEIDLQLKWSGIITKVYTVAIKMQEESAIKHPTGLTPPNWNDRFRNLYRYIREIVPDIPDIEEFSTD